MLHMPGSMYALNERKPTKWDNQWNEWSEWIYKEKKKKIKIAQILIV